MKAKETLWHERKERSKVEPSEERKKLMYRS